MRAAVTSPNARTGRGVPALRAATREHAAPGHEMAHALPRAAAEFAPAACPNEGLLEVFFYIALDQPFTRKTQHHEPSTM